MQHIGRRRAFTLVEILMVVIILGIVSAVLIPQIGTRADLVASAAARQVMSDLTYAQNRAITSQTATYVVFTNAGGTSPAAGGSYRVCTALPSTLLTHPVTRAPWSVSFGTAGAMANVRLDSATFDGQAAIMFDETGAPLSIPASGGTATPLSAGSVRIVCSGNSLTIRVEPLTGTLTVQ